MYRAFFARGSRVCIGMSEKNHYAAKKFRNHRVRNVLQKTKETIDAVPGCCVQYALVGYDI
jgi:hypothetical protein